MIRLFMISILTLGLFVACSGEELVDETLSVGSDDPTPDQAAPGSEYFYINHAYEAGVTRYTRLVNSDGTIDYTKKCAVDLNSTTAADRDIMCVVDSLEFDLFFSGIKLQYNVPKTEKCVYLVQYPFFFWQYTTKTFGAITIDVEKKLGKFQSYTSSDPSITYDGEAGAPVCAFNYTPSEGPDCCEGEYTITTSDDDDDNAGTPDVVSVSKGKFSGKKFNCLGGPAMSGKLSKSGFPLREAIRLDQNLGATSLSKIQELQLMSSSKLNVTSTSNLNTGDYSVSGPITTLYGSNLYISNAYDKAPTAVQYEINTDPNIKAFRGDGGVGMVATNPYYEWACFNAAEEMSGRIRVFVREWNEKTELAKASTTVVGNPNSSGAETDFPDQPKADRSDWLDLITAGGTTALPGGNL